MILVDTSVLVNFFRGRSTAATHFFEKIVSDPFFITPVVFQEILQGAKSQDEFERLREYLTSQFFCFPKHPLVSFEKAARLYFDARRNGVTIRSSIDCLIAQIAIDNSLSLLHDDLDFDKIAQISDLKIVVL